MTKKKLPTSTADGVYLVRDYHDFCTKATPKAERDSSGVGDLWINAITCKKCNEYVRSRNLHDFRYCKCGSCFVDGGSYYQRFGWPEGDSKDYVESHVEYFDDAEVVR